MILKFHFKPNIANFEIKKLLINVTKATSLKNIIHLLKLLSKKIDKKKCDF